MVRDFSKEQFDIVVQAGQSNAQGCGLGPVAEPFMQSGDVFYLNNDFSISMAQEDVWGNDVVGNFSLPFASRYIQDGSLTPGRKLLILRSAVGGTGFLDNRWGLQDDLYTRMMEMIKTALELNSANRMAALLWHQGETDAVLGAGREQHYKNLSTLVKTVRSTFGYDTLPFIAGDFVYHWRNENLEPCLPVIDAMKDVCRDIGNARFIETSGLQSNHQKVGNNDTIHFCREAIYSLGMMYYEAFCGIIGG
ncbi:MAG: sialate O-acetylesterase [Saccharofermentanales bacterium]